MFTELVKLCESIELTLRLPFCYNASEIILIKGYVEQL